MPINVPWCMKISNDRIAPMSKSFTAQQIRDIIFASDIALVRVNVRKKDMTPTVFEFIPAMTANAIVGASTAGGAQAAESRAANNPTLANVYCSIRAAEARATVASLKAEGRSELEIKKAVRRVDGWGSFYCDPEHVISVERNGVEVYRELV
jgi:hypothetical protein